MAEGAELMGPQKRVLDEGVGSGSGGENQAQLDNRGTYGWILGPPLEVRAPAAPMRNNPLFRKRLLPAVNDVERPCHGSDCGRNENESQRLIENADGNSKVLSVVPDKGVCRPWLTVCKLMQKRRRYRR